MKRSKLVIGIGFSVALLSSSVMAAESVKSSSDNQGKSTLSSTSTKPKNLEWDLRNR